MKILVVDQENQLLNFVLRCIEAEHDVRWFKTPDKGRVTRDGEGFKGVRVVLDWRDHMGWVGKDGLIVTAGNWKYIPELDRYRDLGFRVFGPTARSAALEINREAGMKAMQAVGIEQPPYQMFKSLGEAEAFARKSDDCWVFKTLGSEEDKSLSYVSCDPADMVGWIRQKIARGLVLKGPCMLQEKIDMLSEFGVSGWLGPEGFLPGRWQENVEHKKLMDGEVGPATGEMGNVAVYCEHSKLADESLKLLEPVFRTLGHTGDLAIGVGIDTKGKAWPFEFTCRLGYPAFHIQMASHEGDPAQWMSDLLDGKDTLKVSRDVAAGVVMGQPMFPFGKATPERVEGNTIAGLEEVWDDVHPIGVMIGKGPKMEGGKIVDRPTFLTSGEYVLVATGRGKTVEKAREAVYGTVKQIKFADSMYRKDIGLKVIDALPALHRYGYALTML